MTTAIVITVASSFIVLFLKYYLSKEEIVSVQNLYSEAREENSNLKKEIISLKKEIDFLKEKLERTEDYVFTLKAHISDGRPPPPPENKWGLTKDHDEIEQLLSQ